MSLGSALAHIVAIALIVAGAVADHTNISRLTAERDHWRQAAGARMVLSPVVVSRGMFTCFSNSDVALATRTVSAKATP
jgi:hypothetical protein